MKPVHEIHLEEIGELHEIEQAEQRLYTKRQARLKAQETAEREEIDEFSRLQEEKAKVLAHHIHRLNSEGAETIHIIAV